MNAKRLVEMFSEFESERTNDLADTFDRNGANLFGLCSGVDIAPGLICWQHARSDAVSGRPGA